MKYVYVCTVYYITYSIFIKYLVECKSKQEEIGAAEEKTYRVWCQEALPRPAVWRHSDKVPPLIPQPLRVSPCVISTYYSPPPDVLSGSPPPNAQSLRVSPCVLFTYSLSLALLKPPLWCSIPPHTSPLRASPCVIFSHFPPLPQNKSLCHFCW